EYDSERVAGLLRERSWELTADEAEADLILVNTLSSAFSRIAHVLTRIRSASALSAVSSQLRSRTNPATRSESYSFIWQPCGIKWSLAMRPRKVQSLR